MDPKSTPVSTDSHEGLDTTDNILISQNEIDNDDDGDNGTGYETRQQRDGK